MRLLLDECLPPRLAVLLRSLGHDCEHVYERELGGHPDEEVMALAESEGRIVISADTDFGELLANSPVLAPSVVLLRRAEKTAEAYFGVLDANLDDLADDLEAGSLVVISDTRIRVRRLPVKPAQ